MNAATGRVPRDYIFIDESGDPGVGGNPVYLLVAMQVREQTLDRIRAHLTAFRYHNDVVKEMKAQRWADKLTPPTHHLLDFLAELTSQGAVTTTANWLRKETYRAGGGPYLSTPGEATKFRHYQLRRVLQRHRDRTAWSESTDLVIDRWRMNLDQRDDLERYLEGNYALRPRFAYVTLVDSAYCDPIQIVDIYGRLLRRVVEGGATGKEDRLAGRLARLLELTGGLY